MTVPPRQPGGVVKPDNRLRSSGDVGLVQASGAGADREVAPILEGTTAALLEAAFAFPVSVYVPPAGATDAGPLALDVELRYVPTEGTLALSATVSGEGLLRPVPIRCAVHYVRTDGGYRYLVREAGAPLAGGAPLADRVDGDVGVGAGARRRPGRAPGPRRGGVGAGPGRAPGGGVGGPVRRPHGGGRPARRAGRVRPPGRRGPGGPGGRGRARGVRGRGRERPCGPGPVVAAPGLAGARGAATVRGAAFFRPLAPVDPAPPIPAPDDEPAFTAFEDVGGSPDGVVVSL